MHTKCKGVVQVNTSIGTIKYLYLYMYKGHDKAQIQVAKETTDEITRFLEFR
jgi:hypothetical protein